MAINWKISGEYYECCSCSVPCQCVWKQLPDDGLCRSAVSWNIKEGHYGNVRLDGLSTGMLIWAEGIHLEGGWHVVLLIDDRATSEQSEALEDIFLGRAGGIMELLAPLIESSQVARASFSYSHQGTHLSLKVGNVLAMEADAILGFEDKQTYCYPHPFALPSMNMNVGKSTKAVATYDPEFTWNASGRNAFFCDFEYSNA